jgi:hypothetical protein
LNRCRLHIDDREYFGLPQMEPCVRRPGEDGGSDPAARPIGELDCRTSFAPAFRLVEVAGQVDYGAVILAVAASGHWRSIRLWVSGEVGSDSFQQPQEDRHEHDSA